MSDVDVAVIGAGHNALVAAAYLAQAGRSVAVFERAPRVGGAVATEEIVPGYRFDLGGSAHILIRSTPVVEELGLESHGLDYLELDPLFFAPFEDGDHVMLHRSEARTIDGLEARFPGEGAAYARFLEDWRPFARSVRDAFLESPSPLQLGRTMGLRSGLARDFKRLMPLLARPYGSLVDAYFREEKVKAPLVWMAAQSGPPPTEALTAPFVLWHPLYHEDGVARPRGGSGMLSEALARKIRSHGGSVTISSPVEAILVEGGRAVGVRVDGQTVTAKAVLAGAHAVETFERLLPEEHRPRGARQMRTGNGFGAVLRLALSRPVRYAAHPHDDARVALQLLCRDRTQIEAAYGDYLRGEPSHDPPIVAMTFSAVDPSLAPAGGEVLWLWAQYFPYQMSGGSELGRHRRRRRRRDPRCLRALRAGHPRRGGGASVPAPVVAGARARAGPWQRHAPGDEPRPDVRAAPVPGRIRLPCAGEGLVPDGGEHPSRRGHHGRFGTQRRARAARRSRASPMVAGSAAVIPR